MDSNLWPPASLVGGDSDGDEEEGEAAARRAGRGDGWEKRGEAPTVGKREEGGSAGVGEEVELDWRREPTVATRRRGSAAHFIGFGSGGGVTNIKMRGNRDFF